jgi:hypothetical protein
MIFAGGRDLYEITGAVTLPPRRQRRSWQRAWSLRGPLIPIGFGLGLLLGSAAYVATHADPAIFAPRSASNDPR